MENSDLMRTLRNRKGSNASQGAASRLRCVAVLLLLLLSPLAVRAEPSVDAIPEEPKETPAEAAPSTEPEVELNRLLKLPDSYATPSEKRGGASRDEWKRRYARIRADHENAEAARDQAQRGLEAAASDSGQWSVAAPGGSPNENSPLSYGLRQEIRRQREAVEASAKALRQLDIEADLAGIPEAWRE